MSPRFNALRNRERPWRLSRSQRATLAQVARVVCPRHTDELEPDSIGAEHALIDEAEASLRALSPVVRAAIAAALSGYDRAAALRYGKPAHRLDNDRGRDYYEAWLRGPAPTREVALRIKQFVCMAYYELPVVRAAIDYRPEDWIAEVTDARQARYSEAIRAQDAAVLAEDPLPRGADGGLIPGHRLVRSDASSEDER